MPKNEAQTTQHRRSAGTMHVNARGGTPHVRKRRLQWESSCRPTLARRTSLPPAMPSHMQRRSPSLLPQQTARASAGTWASTHAPTTHHYASASCVHMPDWAFGGSPENLTLAPVRLASEDGSSAGQGPAAASRVMPKQPPMPTTEAHSVKDHLQAYECTTIPSKPHADACRHRRRGHRTTACSEGPPAPRRPPPASPPHSKQP